MFRRNLVGKSVHPSHKQIFSKRKSQVNFLEALADRKLPAEGVQKKSRRKNWKTESRNEILKENSHLFIESWIEMKSNIAVLFQQIDVEAFALLFWGTKDEKWFVYTQSLRDSTFIWHWLQIISFLSHRTTSNQTENAKLHPRLAFKISTKRKTFNQATVFLGLFVSVPNYPESTKLPRGYQITQWVIT